MALTTDRRAALVHLAARATNGAQINPTTAGTLRAWRLDATGAEKAQIDALTHPAAPEYNAGQRRAAAVNAQQGELA